MNTRSAIFHRHYVRYSGGHQKVLDYFAHMVEHPGWEPRVFLAGERPLEHSNPWRIWQSRVLADYQPAGHQLAYLAGVDWQAYLALDRPADQPVINLIQHVRHADPASNVYPFLTERAIRVCVSVEVEEAILATGRVNGPTLTIANGVDVDSLVSHRRDGYLHDVYILGVKSRELAQQLAARLEAAGVSLLLHDAFVERADVLAAMASAKVSVLLPNPTEGFYLPALEAMALSDAVVVPDCVGNRSFCLDGENCLMPGRTPAELAGATLEALDRVNGGDMARFQLSAAETLEQHRLERERQQFHELLDRLDTLW